MACAVAVKRAIKRDSDIVHTLDDLRLWSLCGKLFTEREVQSGAVVAAGKRELGWRDCLRCVES